VSYLERRKNAISIWQCSVFSLAFKSQLFIQVRNAFWGPGTDVMIFKILSAKNLTKKLAFFDQNKAKLCQNWIITLVFEKNANFFRRKWAKITENCDHNIDPR
jgi:hypothetical protein